MAAILTFLKHLLTFDRYNCLKDMFCVKHSISAFDNNA